MNRDNFVVKKTSPVQQEELCKNIHGQLGSLNSSSCIFSIFKSDSNMVSNLLSQLPQDLCALVLMEWIELKSLGQDDTAICNKIDRSDLLNIFTSSWFEFKPNATVNAATFQWVVLKTIELQNIVVDMTKTSVKENIAIISQIAGNWTKIREFRCKIYHIRDPFGEYNIDPLWEMIIRNNTKLSVAEFCGVILHQQFFSYVAEHGQQIVNLVVAVKEHHPQLYLHNIEPIWLSCKQLRSVKVMGDHLSVFRNEVGVYFWDSSTACAVYLNNVRYLSHEVFERDMKVLFNVQRDFRLIGFRAVNCTGDILSTVDGTFISFLKTQHNIVDLAATFSVDVFTELRSLMENNKRLQRLVVMVESNSSLNLTCEEIKTLFARNRHEIKSLIIPSASVTDDAEARILAACPSMFDLCVNFAKGKSKDFWTATLRVCCRIDERISSKNWIWNNTKRSKTFNPKPILH